MLASEELVERASHHVDMVKAQRQMFNIYKRKAIKMKDKPRNERTVCFVGDYAQNMSIPNFAEEQPGEVYFFSPLNAYCFGMVDCSTEPSQLAAYTYFEGEGRKGGDNVASMVYHELKRKGLCNDNDPVKEIILVFDNCAPAGQNKNRMVLKFLLVIVQRGWANLARAVFLIKGHTKNDCNRTFNLMKIDYRKKDIFTPDGLIEACSKHDQVTCIRFSPNDFKALSEFQDKHIIGLPRIKNKHIFTVMAADPNEILFQESALDLATHKIVVKRPYCDSRDWAF